MLRDEGCFQRWSLMEGWQVIVNYVPGSVYGSSHETWMNAMRGCYKTARLARPTLWLHSDLTV